MDVPGTTNTKANNNVRQNPSELAEETKCS